jgi:hypothetical protein
MNYFVKTPNKEAWLKLTPYVITQDCLDELVEYAKVKPKFKESVDKLIDFLSPFKVSLSVIKEDKTQYFQYHASDKNYDHIYKFYTHSLSGLKHEAGSYEKSSIEKYNAQLPEIKAIFKVLKNIKFKEGENKNYPHIQYTLNLFALFAKLDDLPKFDLLQFHEDKNQCEFFDDETYVVLYDSGYLDVDGWTNGQLSQARLFPNFSSAQRSLAKRNKYDSNIAIMKISMQCKEVMLGSNSKSDKIKAYAEKKRIEEFLESTTPDELTLLKAKIAEYEQKLNINQSQETPKKKVKI